MSDAFPPADAEPSFEAMTVFVRALRLEAEIGVHPHERGRTQPLFVDIALDLAPRPVAGIADTVNYETLATRARALASGGHVELVETFAEQLATACLDSARALRVRVRVEKPEAIPGAAAAGVEIQARRR
jgi:7,8-dihydroneopterin aldolase/epimerase/oxygenase